MTLASDTDGRLAGPDGRWFTEEQADAVRRREGPLLLAANAGSGKTSVLVERFARMVAEDGLAPGEVLAITFTEKAAGELRSRVRARLLELGLREAARDAEGAWISTIHGFCARVLRLHAVAAGLDPEFTVLDEPAARALRRRSFEAALGDWLGDPDALDLAAAYGPDRLLAVVASVHDELRSRGATQPRLPAVAPPDLAAARTRLEVAARRALVVLERARSMKTIDRAREALRACADALEAGEQRGPAGCAAWTFSTGQAAELRDPAVEEHLAACADYRQALVDAAAAPAIALIDALLQAFARRYAAAKRARSALDYSDLELLARDLLRDQPAVGAALRERFARVMVDEFQDTNPLQLDLLELLGVQDVFVVGDELQSIYGFRHADVGVFRERRAALAAQGRAAALATSFRARPEILATLDAAFGAGHGDGYVPLVAGRTEPADPAGPRVELLVTDATAWDGQTNGSRTPPDADPGLLAAVGAGLEADRDSMAAEARLVAQRVRELVDAGECRAGDVVVLVRALRAMGPFERALQAEGFATLPSGGKGWWGRRQVRDLLAWLAVLANPRDELALLGVLASPLCGVSSDALALTGLARAGGGGPLWDVLVGAYLDEDPAGLRGRIAREDDAKLAMLLEHLESERAAAPRHGLDELLDRAVRATRYDEHVLALPGGVRKLANVRKLQRLAAGFEAREGRDMRGFVDFALAELEADATETDAPVDLGDQDAVRLMTMHAAKGLEFPVVVCAALGRTGNRSSPDLLVDGDRVGLRLAGLDGSSEDALEFRDLREAGKERELAEERRVLHVAMTRAEERLILSGAAALGDRWPRVNHACAPLAWIGPALWPAIAGELTSDAPEHVVAVGDGDGAVRVSLNAPSTVGRILRDPRPEELQLAFDLAGAQAEPTAEPVAGDAAVPAGVRVGRAPGPPRVGALSYSSLGAHAACGYRYYLQRVLRLPEVTPPPHLRGAAGAGPDARLRGTIVHELLEHADLRPGAPPPGPDAARAVAADHDATLEGDALDDVLGLLEAFAGSSVRERLAAAGDVRREVPFALPLAAPGQDPGSAALLNGVVDALAIEPDGTALVVDYKTDRVGEDDLEALVARDYRLQRAAYALAALRAGAPAVQVVHLYLERAGSPVSARYTTGDVPDLQRLLLDAAAPLLAGDFTPTERPHAGLCATCPGRGTLCSRPLELTDRPAPGS